MTPLMLVTGAAGLLGRFVVDKLSRHGARLRGLGRRPGPTPVGWHVGDVTDPTLVAGALTGVDAVLHIAAVPNIWSGDGQTITRVNTLGTYTVLEAAEAAGVGRIVFCSSDSVAGYTVREGRMLPPLYAPLDLDHPLRATDPYAVSKVLGEGLWQAYALRGMAVMALRTVFVAYPEMTGEIRARATDPAGYRGPAVGGPSDAGGGPLHHYIDPRDLARAFRLALDLPVPPGGFERFYLSAAMSLSPEPTVDRLHRLHGDVVAVRDPGLYARQPFASLYGPSHAAERLGFHPEFDGRHLLTQ